MRRSIAVLGLLVGLLGASVSVDAAVCNLTVSGSTCSPFAGAIFTNVLPSPVGEIDAFLRLQADYNEKGYNTSADFTPGGSQNFQYDQQAGSATHDLLLSDIPIVNIGGIDYRQFLLNINESTTGDSELLSLDELQIFLSPNGNLGVDNVSEYDPSGNGNMGTLKGLNAVYDLDTGSNNFVALNYALNPGAGTADMIVYIPSTLFTQAGNPQYVYLYSEFGKTTSTSPCTTGCKSSDSFEEWWVKVPSSGVTSTATPEPGSLLLVGGGLMLLGRNLRRRRR